VREGSGFRVKVSGFRRTVESFLISGLNLRELLT